MEDGNKVFQIDTRPKKSQKKNSKKTREILDQDLRRADESFVL